MTDEYPSFKDEYPFVSYNPSRYSEEEQLQRARSFYEFMDTRRSVRDFSPDPVPRELIELAIKTASTAPSGAHRQPWQFVAVSDQGIKEKIREAAEKEEQENYGNRMPEEWLLALRPLGTNANKSYLTVVPWIVVLFEETQGLAEDGSTRKNYYVKESVGIAAGMFISALHNMGLATLTHTPSPMRFLSKILGRPKNERPFILFPVGYPAENAQIPYLKRKPLEKVSIWNPHPSADEE